MRIRQLKMINFRNYSNMTIDFSDHYNLIHGNNGMGKTNLIEAIYVLALTKSFRGTVDKVVIMNNRDSAKIEGKIHATISSTYQIIISNDGKKVKIDSNNIPKLSDYISKISVILFNPDDLRIIKDTPSIRRKNLNVDISQLNNVYLKLLSTYNKYLKQRNMYLRSMNINANTDGDFLNVLTEKIIDIGLKIYSYRKEFIEKINIKLGSIYFKITGEEGLSIKYMSDYADLDKKKLLALYKKNLQRDIVLGKTQLGVHHDDIIFIKEDKNLKDYGSEGQQKNSIISYKLAEIQIFKEQKNEYPILILDDLFSELDNEKINNILGLLDTQVQTFITTTDISQVDKEILENSKIIKVEKGSLREE